MTLEGEEDMGKAVETAVAASKPRTDLVNADIRSRYVKYTPNIYEFSERRIFPCDFSLMTYFTRIQFKKHYCSLGTLSKLLLKLIFGDT